MLHSAPVHAIVVACPTRMTPPKTWSVSTCFKSRKPIPSKKKTHHVQPDFLRICALGFQNHYCTRVNMKCMSMRRSTIGARLPVKASNWAPPPGPSPSAQQGVISSSPDHHWDASRTFLSFYIKDSLSSAPPIRIISQANHPRAEFQSSQKFPFCAGCLKSAFGWDPVYVFGQ